MPTLTPKLVLEYKQLFDGCVIQSEKFPAIDKIIRTILDAKPRYETIEANTNVPWFFIGIIHCLEANINFEKHLHNGDPLTARTKQVPMNRPKTGNPPFMWEASATDALQLKSLDKWEDWSIPGMLFQFERYNGFGYRPRGINSPYLWSFSNHYVKGKFVKDGIFNENAVSKQCGAAVLLRRMSEKQVAVMGELDSISQIKKLGSKVSFAPKKFNPQAEELQKLLNGVGLHLRIDGFAGRMTSDAYFAISGEFLAGDKK